jgi:hypothetical protein
MSVNDGRLKTYTSLVPESEAQSVRPEVFVFSAGEIHDL